MNMIGTCLVRFTTSWARYNICNIPSKQNPRINYKLSTHKIIDEAQICSSIHSSVGFLIQSFKCLDGFWQLPLLQIHYRLIYFEVTSQFSIFRTFQSIHTPVIPLNILITEKFWNENKLTCTKCIFNVWCDQFSCCENAVFSIFTSFHFV